MRGERGMREHDEMAADLAGALRPADVDDASARAAVAAFRTARDAGLHVSRRTRRREDWRPAERRVGRSLRATLSALAASLTLGGVAVAAVLPVGPFGDTESREPGSRLVTAVPQPPEGPASPSSGSPGSSSPSSSRATAAPLDPRTSARPPRTDGPPCHPHEKVPGRAGAVEAPGRKGSAGQAGGREPHCDSLPDSATTSSSPASGRGYAGAPPKAPSAWAPGWKRAVPPRGPRPPVKDAKTAGQAAGDRG
ncbi:hypothetical protein ACFVU3_30060 [Streptomyces sp. NPDC058052]|uniref:hypothetical protein n=1 Tax=Streptomyces sp. NPDC058052 TaxID=3346316 RepID=UPI0036F15A79